MKLEHFELLAWFAIKHVVAWEAFKASHPLFTVASFEYVQSCGGWVAKASNGLPVVFRDYRDNVVAIIGAATVLVRVGDEFAACSIPTNTKP